MDGEKLLGAFSNAAQWNDNALYLSFNAVQMSKIEFALFAM